MTHLFLRFVLFCLAVLFCVSQTATQAAAQAAHVSHLGPAIKIAVQRGDQKLPIYWVNHLQKGDKLLVSTDQAQKTEAKWLLVLATVTPVSNLVETRPFDLTEAATQPSIDITSDDQIPVVVLAPQVRTMFGLHTSFSESAALISDAIKTDPQRFIDLQKIDQINHAINYLLHALDAVIQTKKNEQAIDAAKALAAKFGVRYIDPDCFKDAVVNTKCVAASIVSSADLVVPSDDTWSATGPNAAAAKMPTDIFVGMKLITETSSYLVNKYGDNYDFAPALGQRLGSSDAIQLFTNARFKSGDVKTAYIYVPSWFDNRTPDIKVDAKTPSCLTKNEISASVKGNLPLLNYWHDWKLVLREHGSDNIVAQYKKVDFKPDTGTFILTVDSDVADINTDGQLLDATLTGRFGFTDVNINPFSVIMPARASLLGQIDGLDNLVSGEQAKLALKPRSNTCIQKLALQVNGSTLNAAPPSEPVAEAGINPAPVELHVDLSKVAPGPATLQVQQYGAPTQTLPVKIAKRRAHLQKITHYDLESVIAVSGDNLDRIAAIQLNGKLLCQELPAADSATPESASVKVFSCPAELASTPNLSDKATISYKDAEPAAFDFPISKMAARPHMIADGSNAIVIKLSASALQWNLGQKDAYLSEDSGLGLLLHAFGGYRLSRGAYQLQLRFSDDQQNGENYFTVPLMSDLAHNELRSKKPITFDPGLFPSVVNPVWYRVQHQPSGLTGDWQPLNRSIIYLPQLSSVSCDGQTTLVHGAQLELIDAVSTDLSLTPADADKLPKAALTQCGTDQCLALHEPANSSQLKIKLHWIDNRLFDVNFPQAPNCVNHK